MGCAVELYGGLYQLGPRCGGGMKTPFINWNWKSQFDRNKNVSTDWKRSTTVGHGIVVTPWEPNLTKSRILEGFQGF